MRKLTFTKMPDESYVVHDIEDDGQWVGDVSKNRLIADWAYYSYGPVLIDLARSEEITAFLRGLK